jgi:hypothetical protein
MAARHPGNPRFLQYRECSRSSRCSNESGGNCVGNSRIFGTLFAEVLISGFIPSAQGAESLMRFFEGWWQRTPLFVRAALCLVSIVAMLLGGSASGYWQ